jgi:hypothetical protein
MLTSISQMILFLPIPVTTGANHGGATIEILILDATFGMLFLDATTAILSLRQKVPFLLVVTGENSAILFLL